MVRLLDDRAAGSKWLAGLGVRRAAAAHNALLAMAEAGLTTDLMLSVASQLEQHLPMLGKPDLALSRLSQFTIVARNPLSIGSLFERDPDSLPTLLKILSYSDTLADLLVQHPESYDLLRMTDGQPVARDILVQELTSELFDGISGVEARPILDGFYKREQLRIAFGQLVRYQHATVVGRQNSYLADALIQATLNIAMARETARRGAPLGHDGQPARLVVMSVGKLGAQQLDFSCRVKLMFVYDQDGFTTGDQRQENKEFFQRVATRVTKLLAGDSDQLPILEIEHVVLVGRSQGPLVVQIKDAVRHYENSGRTYQRQELITMRPVAGDLELGKEFARKLERWIYRRFLSRADITGIKALKRRIDRDLAEGTSELNLVEDGGGQEETEFAIQFLQLINGGNLPELRVATTVEAIEQLSETELLSSEERSVLLDSYCLITSVIQRMQLMIDAGQQHLPQDRGLLEDISRSLAYEDSPEGNAIDRFQNDISHAMQVNGSIVDRLLADAFEDDLESEPESNLVLDPDPSEEMIAEVLSKHNFQRPLDAYHRLVDLANEKIPFLSTRKCRHFLSIIAPQLLDAIAKTPSPDHTLDTLARVSDSIGGKATLWELFQLNPATLSLYVRLCATSPYLSGVLTSYPGMIDELMDSLMLDKLPTAESLQDMVSDLLRGTDDVEAMLHVFKQSQHLSVGVRDILGKETLQDTHRALSDIAEVCLKEITEYQYARLVEKFGTPTITAGNQTGEPASLLMLALGKLGGREPNYHSDCDVVFLYDHEGETDGNNKTSNSHFFNELSRRIIHLTTGIGIHGRLYEMDGSLRASHQHAPLAISLADYEEYLNSGEVPYWQYQGMCKARVIYGQSESRLRVEAIVREALLHCPAKNQIAKEIHLSRMELEKGASPRNLKRGAGGTMDVEFIVQSLQLRFGLEHPEILVSGTLDAIRVLTQAGLLSGDDGQLLEKSYDFLRSIESGLRLMDTLDRHDIPESVDQLEQLAFLLGYDSPQTLVTVCDRYRRENRGRFTQLVSNA